MSTKIHVAVISVQVRAMMRPPAGVRLVIDAVSIMREVKPKKVAGEKMGTKVDDYWEPGKALLQDPGKVRHRQSPRAPTLP